MSKTRDPDHPILPKAHTWEIVGLNLQREPEDEEEPYLDLTLRKDQSLRRLRFWSPQDLQIEEGGPRMTHGLMILDVRRRGLEGLGVQVADFENTHGSVRFMARAVEELKETSRQSV